MLRQTCVLNNCTPHEYSWPFCVLHNSSRLKVVVMISELHIDISTVRNNQTEGGRIMLLYLMGRDVQVLYLCVFTCL